MKPLILGALVATFIVWNARAANPDAAVERIDLEGRPLASVSNETVIANGDLRVVKLDKPNLQLLPCRERTARGTVLLFPGGGYKILAVTKEGASVAQVLHQAGYDVALLEYTIDRPDARDKALADALAAVRLLRQRGKEFGLRTGTLGVMGFSAGGHLAARVMHALGAKEGPDFGVLIYPAYLDHGQELQPDVIPPAGAKTAIFALIADNDQPGWIFGTKAYIEACQASGQRQEFHLLHGGGHGFGIELNQKPPVAGWPDLLKAFLNAPKPGDADYPQPSPSARHTEKVRAVKSGNYNLVLIGDSITQCVAAYRRAGELTAQVADGQHVFWLDIGHVFLRPDGSINTNLMPDRIHPNADGAETWAQHVLWRIDHGEPDGLAPRHVVLMIGANNVLNGSDADSIVAGIRAKVPEAKCDFLDGGDKFLDAKGNIPKSLMDDAIHPTPTGYRFWSAALEPVLKEDDEK